MLSCRKGRKQKFEKNPESRIRVTNPKWFDKTLKNF